MQARMNIIVLAEALRKNPPKSSIDFIQCTKNILLIFQNNPQGNTFLRFPHDKPIIEHIEYYLKPFLEPLNLKVYYNLASYLHISNMTDLTFKQLDKIMAEEKVSQSYKRIISALISNNEYLTSLLHQKKVTENHHPVYWHQMTPYSGKDSSSPMDLSEGELPPEPEEKKSQSKDDQNPKPTANGPPKPVQAAETDEEYDKDDELEIKHTLTAR